MSETLVIVAVTFSIPLCAYGFARWLHRRRWRHQVRMTRQRPGPRHRVKDVERLHRSHGYEWFGKLED